MKRIMLIDPPGFRGNAIGRILGSFGTNKADQAWPPYDLQIFAGYCLKNSHDYRILDANNLKVSHSCIQKEIREYSPDWVIYVTAFPNFMLDASVASDAKKVNPLIKTACMSLSMLSVEQPGEKLASLPDLDYIAWGEPEIPLMQLINGEEPASVKGIYFKKQDRTVGSTGIALKVTSLDELGVPRHDRLDLKIYKCPLSLRRPMAIVNCSRGCVNACVHCQAGNFQSPVRYRSLENVLEELRGLRTLGVREIKFYDCSLPTDKNFTERLCDAMVREKLIFTWNCNSRAEMLDCAILEKMKAAGCHTIAIGCESANDDILKGMEKNETSAQIAHAVRLVKKHGMRVLMYLTFGLEGETRETMNETYEFARKLKPDFVTFGIVVPAPGTAFHRALAKKGLLKDKQLEWQDPNALPSFCYPWLPPNELHAFTRSAYKKYYFNPGYIFRKLRSFRSVHELKSAARNAASMLTRYFLERTK
jgi:anaerobic magnesium-protoporphyrin IX monomethyl ester cyclase